MSRARPSNATVAASPNFQELHTSLKESLDQRGVLAQVQATMRAEIFNALENHEAVHVNQSERAPSSENLILNELIREYLEYNGFLNTLSVFHPETGQPREATGRIGRTTMIHELGLNDGERTKRVPLLYSVLAKLQASAVGAQRSTGATGATGATSRDTGTGNNLTGFDLTMSDDSDDHDPLSQSMASRNGQAIGFSN